MYIKWDNVLANNMFYTVDGASELYIPKLFMFS